ncbi:MAG: serine/threonine protein kinase, partial [Armatimonadetes bacterium]|nr:serine/threonine protein kinase [Armatimonadota bacterium]
IRVEGGEAAGMVHRRVARVRVRCERCGAEVEADTVSPRAAGELQVFVCGTCAEQARRQGVQVPGYRGFRSLDEGGMGRLWVAERESDGERVVIKTMRPECAVSRRGVERFLREIRLMQRLEHPNIVRFIEAGTCGGMLYIVMEYVEGTDAERLRAGAAGGRLEPRVAVDIVQQVLSALEYAHSLRPPVYHRDIKPANILLEGRAPRYTAKLADFGLARARETHSITLRGEGLGTLPFMPPEQIAAARSVDERADIFGIGATLYYLVTGEFVYNFPHGASQGRAAQVVAEGGVVPVQRRGVRLPARLEEVINRATAPQAQARYATAREMRRALAEALQ